MPLLLFQAGCPDRQDETMPLSANFSASPVFGKVPLAVHFTDTSTGHVTSWEWNLQGDGAIESTSRDVTWVYTTKGEYTVLLTVKGPAGSSTVRKKECIKVYEGIAYVDDESGCDTNTGMSPISPLKTIQKGLDIADDDWLVLVADGVYAGDGNKNLDFRGKKLKLKSSGGAANCVIDCEDEGRGFHFHSGERRWAVVDGFTVTRGYFDYYDPMPCGGAILCEGASPTIKNCTMKHNRVNSAGGAIYCISSQIHIVDCAIVNNDAAHGGAMFCTESSPYIVCCNISNNSAHMEGGAICFWHNCHPDIFGCLIAGNSAYFEGGGITCRDHPGVVPYDECSDMNMLNCTIAFNSLTAPGCMQGSGIHVDCERAKVGLENTIVWGNTAAEGSQILVGYSSSQYARLVLDCCCYPDGPDGVGGADEMSVYDCIHLDPLFVDGPGADYHLKYRSPCIDTGNFMFASYYLKHDLDGRPRIQGTAVDIGAYEKR
jgi:PKD repeat protein